MEIYRGAAFFALGIGLASFIVILFEKDRHEITKLLIEGALYTGFAVSVLIFTEVMS